MTTLTPKTSYAVWAFAPVLVLGPALTCGIPRVMALLFILSSVLAVVADSIQRRALPKIDKKLAAFFGALIAFGAVSFLWTVSPDDTLKKTGQLLAIFVPTVMLIPVIGSLNRQDLCKLGCLAGVGLIAGAGVYLNEMYNNFPFYDGLRGGYSKDVADIKQNKPAVLLCFWLYACLPFFMAFKKKLWGAGAFLAGTVLIYYTTFSSESESAQMVLLLLPVLWLFIYYVPARISLKLTLGVTALLAVMMPFIAYGMMNHTAWQNNPYFNNSIKSRIEIWDQAARRTAEKPILGWGMDSSEMIPSRGERSWRPEYEIHHLHPHNSLMQIWQELGVVGVAFLLGLFALFYRRINNMADTMAQKYTVFMWSGVFLYTLSIWGLWQTWFTATLTFMGIMAYAGARYLSLRHENTAN